jgi:predicted GNAT superfamily acetyltransferase
MLDADEAYFKEHGVPLFSSHMLDLSEEPKEENIATCVKYFTRMAKMNRSSLLFTTFFPFSRCCSTRQLNFHLLCLLRRVARDGDRYHRW